MSPVRFLVLISASIVTSGCGLTMMAPVVIEGQAFEHTNVPRLVSGMSKDQVQALLGAPLRESHREGAVVWTYDERRQRRECVPYFGPIPLGPLHTDRHVLELTFGTHGLDRAVYRERTRDKDEQRVLVDSRR